MSTSSRNDIDYHFDVEELLEIGTRCSELRKEKEMLKESQSQSFELIKRLEQHVKSLSEAHTQDKKHIQKLETELMNCSQEIDYLQDQLNASNAEISCLSEHAHNLELKLSDMESLQEQVEQLREELRRSYSDRMLMMQQIESKEVELQNSALCIEKLEESISSIALDSQCEIESVKLDLMSMEHNFFEAKKIQEENAQEKARMSLLIEELEVQVQNAQEIIKNLDKENKELREKLFKYEKKAGVFYQKISEWLEGNDRSQFNVQSFLKELETKLALEDMSVSGEASGVFSEASSVLASDGDFKEKIESMPHQIHEYKVIVKQLKEELREERLKAKEEAEDLAQEMAELRYQMTCLLEEERKRRACIEQASLQRIAELEAQIQNEPQRSLAVVRCDHQT
ncbi:hypothetical protein SLA2020_003740 [Shorea laevis]